MERTDDRHTGTVAWKIARILLTAIYAVLLAYVAILANAFVLLLIGADPDRNYTDWIYRSSARIMQPFRGVFPTTGSDGQSIFDASILFAIIVYSMIGAFVGLAADRIARHIDGDDARGPGAVRSVPPPPPPPPPVSVSMGPSATNAD